MSINYRRLRKGYIHRTHRVVHTPAPIISRTADSTADTQPYNEAGYTILLHINL